MDDSTSTPLFVTTAALIWSQAKEAATAYNNVLGQIQSAEAAARPGVDTWGLASGRIKEVCISEFWEAISIGSLREAVKQFNPPGTKIEIHEQELEASVPELRERRPAGSLVGPRVQVWTTAGGKGHLPRTGQKARA